jgi:hypothetical protein
MRVDLMRQFSHRPRALDRSQFDQVRDELLNPIGLVRTEVFERDGRLGRGPFATIGAGKGAVCAKT